MTLDPYSRLREFVPQFLRATLRSLRRTRPELHSSAAQGNRPAAKEAYTRASELSREGRHDEAIHVLNQILSQAPADLHALVTKATMLASAGQLPASKAVATEALALDPKNLTALETLAHVENALGDHERSLSLFRQLASHKGLDESLARMIADQMRAIAYARANDSASMGRYDEAVRTLDEILSAEPADLHALSTKAAILASAGRLPESRAVVAEALTLDSENLVLLETLAHVENALGEHEHALSLFRQLASLKGFDESLSRMIESQTRALEQKRVNEVFAQANELSSKHRYDEAIQILDEILSADPAHLSALLTKGTILLSAGRLPEARVALVEVLTVEPQNLTALETLAHAASASGEHEQALSLFRQLAAHKGLDENLARLIGDQSWAVDEKRRGSSTFKDVEEGCPPIEQVIGEIEERAAQSAPEDPTVQVETVERLSRQIAAQRSVLGRLDNLHNFYDYTLTQQRFRTMALHSYRGTPFKWPEQPVQNIPETMRAAFSMDGRVELSQGYVNSALPPECTEGIDDNAVRTFLALNYERLPPNAKPKAACIVDAFVPIPHSQTTKTFDRGTTTSDGGSPNDFFGKMPALHPIPPLDLRDKSVAVVASPDLYLEAILICLCRELTSVRLRNVEGSTAHFKSAFLLDWLRQDGQYDLIICPSLVESWGLGRHGEPLDPDADIGLMQRFREKLRPNGTCCIQLPVGRDRVIFNTMRIYGTYRLPAILQGWSAGPAAAVKPHQLTARAPVREDLHLEPNWPVY